MRSNCPSDAQPGTILEEMQRGYTLHDRLLRPARVLVAGDNNAVKAKA